MYWAKVDLGEIIDILEREGYLDFESVEESIEFLEKHPEITKGVRV